MQLDNLFEVIKQIGQKPFIDFVDLSTKNSINKGTTDYSRLSLNGFVFKQFKSLEDSFNKKNEIEQKVNKKNYEIQALTNVTKSHYNDYKSFTEYLDDL